MKDSLAAALEHTSPHPAHRRNSAPATVNQALDVVLERTRRGDEELAHSRLGLGSARRQLLGALDGQRTLGEVVPQRTDADRLAADAARLVAFGLARQVRHELPRRFMVAAMNLTLRVPRAAVLSERHARRVREDAAAEGRGSFSIAPSVAGRMAIVLLGLLLFAVAVGIWVMR